jgi:hypothetical protein
MRKIDDGDTIRELTAADLVAIFQEDVDDLHHADPDEAEFELIYSQYAYVKFGLILEKVRNQCIWKRCIEKFNDFRAFCQKKVNLNIWQAANAIKSATVAVNLAYLGFTELPRNASQALKLSELSLGRLSEVWGNVLKSCEGHKITALAIESQINPDKQVTSSTIKLPSELLEKLQREAIDSEISLEQLIEELLADRHAANSHSEPVECDMAEVTAEIINNVDRQFRSIASPQIIDRTIETTLDRFDDFMNGLIGQFIPPPNRKSHG